MAKTRKVGLVHRERRLLGYLRALITRDPLTDEFLQSPCSMRLTDDDYKLYCKYQDRFSLKWGVGVSVDALPPWPSELSNEQIPDRLKDFKNKKEWDHSDLALWCHWMFASGIKPKHVMVGLSSWPIRWTVNGGCVGRDLLNRILDAGKERFLYGFFDSFTTACKELSEGRLTEGWDGYHGRPCFALRQEDLNSAHSVTLEVDLASITTRNLNDVAKEIKQTLKAVLKYAPHAPKRKQSGDLDFLRTISPKQFDLTITAYDLHMREGLTLAETARRLGRSQTRIEADVKRIYLAIHRKGYTARRRRLDTPAEGIEKYYCPKHGRGCPEKCEYMNTWLERANRALPTESTGTGRRVHRERKGRTLKAGVDY